MNKTLLKSTWTLIFLTNLAFLGCGKQTSLTTGSSNSSSIDLNNLVVRSMIRINVGTGESPVHPVSAVELQSFLAVSEPITVIESPQTSITLNNSDFSPPTITPNVLNFGYLGLSSLLDNDLQVCGTNGNQKCNTALIRIYTTGVAGAGLYNSAGGYGAPLLVSQGTDTPSVVGLGAANAVVLQTYAIPRTTNVLRLTDFSPTPLYNIQADFTNAGTGSYETTIVIEYDLSL